MSSLLRIDLWRGKAPGELDRNTGTLALPRPGEHPPVVRIGQITRPQLHRYKPRGKGNGAAVVIVPGGGFNYVVADKEGSEAAAWLTRLGFTCFLLYYRTKLNRGPEGDPSKRALEDAQQSIRLVRSRGRKWGIDPTRVGILGFSAGGQIAALASTNFTAAAPKAWGKISSRPDFALLVYPWQLVDGRSGKLTPRVRVRSAAPPTFLVHAHDDNSTALSSVRYYEALLAAGVPAELHIYAQGGHGYGIRRVRGTRIHTWVKRAEDWFRQQRLISAR